MTTDSERISRLEGIAEQTNTLLNAILRRQDDLHAEMQAGDAALRTSIDNLTRTIFIAAVGVGLAMVGVILTFILR